jgi:hypothetical protein
MNTSRDEIRHRTSLAISVAVHALFIIICGMSFASCWKMPDPLEVPGTVGVSFGEDLYGKGDSEDIVENPSIENQQEQSEPSTSQDQTSQVTDTDSDVPTDKTDKQTNKPTNNSKPTPPNKSTNDKPSNSTNSNVMGGGKGTDDQAGNQGKKNQMGSEGSGGQGTENLGGKGLKIAGWKIAKDAKKCDAIESGGVGLINPGVVTIEITVSPVGKIVSAVVKSDNHTTSERAAIKTCFMNSFQVQKLESNDSNTPVKGTYTWDLTN